VWRRLEITKGENYQLKRDKNSWIKRNKLIKWKRLNCVLPSFTKISANLRNASKNASQHAQSTNPENNVLSSRQLIKSAQFKSLCVSDATCASRNALYKLSRSSISLKICPQISFIATGLTPLSFTDYPLQELDKYTEYRRFRGYHFLCIF